MKRASHECAQETGIHTTYHKIQAIEDKVDNIAGACKYFALLDELIHKVGNGMTE